MKAHWLQEGSSISASSIPRGELQEQGIWYESVDTGNPAVLEGVVERMAKEHGYAHNDEVALSPSTPQLDGICAKFIREHCHEEDEVRLVLEGTGIFDIRSKQDDWMRVVVEAGDLVVVPAGRYHRFMLGAEKKIRCVRLFRNTSGWVPQYRAQ